MPQEARGRISKKSRAKMAQPFFKKFIHGGNLMTSQFTYYYRHKRNFKELFKFKKFFKKKT